MGNSYRVWGLRWQPGPRWRDPIGACVRSFDIYRRGHPIFVTPKFELTSAQRHAIYQDLHKERSKLAPSLFAARVGADVPPIIELHALYPTTFSQAIRKPNYISSQSG